MRLGKVLAWWAAAAVRHGVAGERRFRVRGRHRESERSRSAFHTGARGGMTRVDLEHRYFERHGPSGAMARMAVDSPNGWTGVLQLFVARMERAG